MVRSSENCTVLPQPLKSFYLKINLKSKKHNEQTKSKTLYWLNPMNWSVESGQLFVSSCGISLSKKVPVENCFSYKWKWSVTWERGIDGECLCFCDCTETVSVAKVIQSWGAQVLVLTFPSCKLGITYLVKAYFMRIK